MARKSFVLCSAPHGGRYARIDETSGDLLRDIEAMLKTPITESKVSEHMPIYIQETIDQMKELYDLGVRFFHDHAFDLSGIHSTATQFYEAIETGLREIDPEVIHSVASSNRRGAGIVVLYNIIQELKSKNIDPSQVDPNDSYHLSIFINGNIERFKGSLIPVPPDTITTITNLEYTISSKVIPERAHARLFSATHPELIQGYYQKHIQQLENTGVNHEIEVSTMKAFDIIEHHFENKAISLYNKIGDPVHFVILFNFTNGLLLNDDNVKKVLQKIQEFKQRNPSHKVAVTFGLVILPKLAAKTKRNKGKALPTNSAGKYLELDYRELIEMTLKHDTSGLVGCFRVGTEDTSIMYGKQQNDIFFIKEILGIFSEYGLSVEENTLAARNVFNLPPRGKKVPNPGGTPPPSPSTLSINLPSSTYNNDDPNVIEKYNELVKDGYAPLIDIISNPYFEVGEDDFDEFIERTDSALRKIFALQPIMS